jgi:hypothetical protein
MSEEVLDDVDATLQIQMGVDCDGVGRNGGLPQPQTHLVRYVLTVRPILSLLLFECFFNCGVQR